MVVLENAEYVHYSSLTETLDIRSNGEEYRIEVIYKNRVGQTIASKMMLEIMIHRRVTLHPHLVKCTKYNRNSI